MPREARHGYANACAHGASRLVRSGMRSAAQRSSCSASQAWTKPLVAMLGEHAIDDRVIGLGRGGAEGERDRTEAQFEQAVAAAGLAVVVALGRGARDDLDLPVVQAEPPIDRGDLRLDRALVGKEDACRAALDDRWRDRAAIDVGERLGGEDDGGVLLAQRLQPFAQLRGEAAVVEREPALVDDEERRAAVEPAFDAMEEIGEYGAGGAGADQALGLERLHGRLAEPLALGVEQPAIGAADAVRPQRLLELRGLQQHGKPGQRPLADRGAGERGERGPEMLLQLGRQRDLLARRGCRRPSRRPRRVPACGGCRPAAGARRMLRRRPTGCRRDRASRRAWRVRRRGSIRRNRTRRPASADSAGTAAPSAPAAPTCRRPSGRLPAYARHRRHGARSGTASSPRSGRRTAAAPQSARPAPARPRSAESGIMWARFRVETGGWRTLA